MSSAKTADNSIKKSRSLYATAVYGFIALFIIMVLPFIPTSSEGSLFESGIKMFNNRVKGNLIVTISMLVHSVILLIIGIVFIHKLKVHRAGVGYSFYNLFKTTIILAVLIYIGFDVFGYLTVLNESYGLVYWFIVLIIYVLGLIFALIAHLSNYELRASKWKALYLVLSWIFKLSMLIIFLVRAGGVGSRYFIVTGGGMDEAASGIQDYQAVVRITDVYHTFNYILLIIALFATLNICMPLNEPFDYMSKSNRKNSKDSPLPVWKSVVCFICYLITFITFVSSGGKEELPTCALLVVGGLIEIICAKLYNKYAAVQVVSEDEDDFKGLLKGDEDEEVDDDEVYTEGGESQSVHVASGIKVWEEKKLNVQNESLDFKKKPTIDKMSLNLYEAVCDGGVSLGQLDVQKTLAALLSSKIVFVSSNSKSSTLKRFADAVSGYFGGELFYESRGKVLPTQEYKSFADKLVASRNTLSANENGDEEGEKPLSESERLTNIKYGVTGGMYVANYMTQIMGLVFIDNTKSSTFSESDSALISAIIENNESVQVGKSANIPESNFYVRGNMRLADNLRLVIFINSENLRHIKPQWIKYSSIIELALSDTEVVQNSNAQKNDSSYGMIYESLEETQESCFLTEDYWRKLDRLEEYLEENTDIKFDNKFLRQIESNVAAFLACGMLKEEALDTILATKIIPLAATQKDKILEAHEADFSFKLDELFGFENIPQTKQAILAYGLKK